MEYSQTVRHLRTHGYREAQILLEPGDLVIKGDVIQVWPAAGQTLWRIHFLGEKVEKVETAIFVSPEIPIKWEESKESHPFIPNNSLPSDYGEILPGDYIVHHVHGVGLFRGIVEAETRDYGKQPYIALEYASNDRLLVPLDRQAELMPYIGGKKPRLTRLYSTSWARLKQRIQRDLVKIARGLLKIYAARQLHQREPFKAEPTWLEQLENGVDYQLTPDQARSVAEVVHDLTVSTEPMDRLLCGDVGFGKTEVALRAAAVVLASGKQVALLAPTTILVEQHYALLQDRFKNLPVKIGRLSRISKATELQTVEEIKSGKLDLIVGTHRLLAKDINWADLGLLIIDEEQKFGVAQKERLKQLRPTVDVLTLTATPIPRTLSMSLSGLRGLSLLRRAPEGRKAIETIVEEYSDGLMGQAIIEEVNRGGQVYVVQNRVKPLPFVKARIEQMMQEAGLSEVVVGLAHGQMPELELAKVMGEFMHGKIQVLVASTIVENGLDSPLANTLVVLRSECFGLSDLYQLRGRVGRRTTQAKAYFMLGGIEHETGYAVPENDPDLILKDPNYADVKFAVAGLPITKSARQRLHALMEAEELGSGWTIALRDLEIRGGGNVLGHEQHGNMEAVGLLLYGQLLQEEIGKQAKALGIKLFQSIPE